jgi:hypothetical protein
MDAKVDMNFQIYHRLRDINSSSVFIIQLTKCSSNLWYLTRCLFRSAEGISTLQTPHIINYRLNIVDYSST